LGRIGNTFLFTDSNSTYIGTFRLRKEQADKALDALITAAEETESIVDILPSNEIEARLMIIQRDISPEEVEAVLESSKIKWPLKTLMAHYKVDAHHAKEILDNAMEGLISKYKKEEEDATRTITRLQVVRDAAALTVVVGGTIITAGGVGGALTVVDGATAAIAGSNAVVKATKSAAELYIGQDGALDEASNNNIVFRGIAAADEVVSIRGLFLKPETGLDLVNKFIYTTGKMNDFLAFFAHKDQAFQPVPNR